MKKLVGVADTLAVSDVYKLDSPIFSVTINKSFIFFTDPVTKQFLSDNLDSVFGFPQIVRFSWSTADTILQESAVPVAW